MMPNTLKRLLRIKIILILIALLLSAEILVRITCPNPYEIEYPHFWETNFQYDSYYGWVSKSNFIVDLKPFGFENIVIDHRGFPIIPDIKNDRIENEKKILFIGRCDTFGGPMIGSEKSFMGLLARETGARLDIDSIGVSGYTFYQEYLLNQQHNHGGNDLVIVSFCPQFDFYLDTKFFMYSLGNRLVPHPQVKDGRLTHKLVPYVKSYWEANLPEGERFSLKEKVLLNNYLLSKIISKVIKKKSFDVDLTNHILKELKKDVENKGGRLALLVFNWCPDKQEPFLTKVTDEFITWLIQNNVGVIDVRRKLVGYSLAKMGDPTHVSVDGQKIMKEEILSYLNKTGFLVDTGGGSL